MVKPARSRHAGGRAGRRVGPFIELKLGKKKGGGRGGGKGGVAQLSAWRRVDIVCWLGSRLEGRYGAVEGEGRGEGGGSRWSSATASPRPLGSFSCLLASST